MREQISKRREEKSTIWRLRRTRNYRAHAETYASRWGWQKLWAGSAGRWSACRCNSQNPPGWDQRRGEFRRPWSSLATSETLRGKKQMRKSSACKETRQNSQREVIRLSQSNRLSQHQQCRRAFFLFSLSELFSAVCRWRLRRISFHFSLSGTRSAHSCYTFVHLQRSQREIRGTLPGWNTLHTGHICTPTPRCVLVGRLTVTCCSWLLYSQMTRAL